MYLVKRSTANDITSWSNTNYNIMQPYMSCYIIERNHISNVIVILNAKLNNVISDVYSESQPSFAVRDTETRAVPARDRGGTGNDMLQHADTLYWYTH